MDISIEEFKLTLKGLPKEEKLVKVQQEINNLHFAGSHKPQRGMTQAEIEHSKQNPPKPLSDEEQKKIESNRQKEKQKKQAELVRRTTKIQELEGLLNEIKSNNEAYESLTKRRELMPFMYDRDLNWYFNTKNIPAQEKLVIPTFEYFDEGPGKAFFEPLDFLNLLEKQQNDLLKNIDRPFEVLQKLKAIPLTEREQHILFGFILKWFGGYPVQSVDEQCRTTLRFIEKEFLKYSEHTSEKEFCAKNLETQRQLGELAAHLSATMEGVTVLRPNENSESKSREFPESHYFHLIKMDFEDLPHYVIQRGIIWRFESKRMQEADYIKWEKDLTEFLNTVPDQYRFKALTKGIQYGRLVYKHHLDNDCTNPTRCVLNESWERRLTLGENILHNSFQNSPDVQATSTNNFVLNEQVLSKIDFIRLINVLYELRAFKNENGQYPDKKEVVEAFGKLVGRDLKNFHPDLNKAYEKSEDANSKIFDIMKNKSISLWNEKNYK